MLGQSLETIATATEPRTATLDIERVRDVVLVRVATVGRVLAREDLARELHPLVSHVLAASAWAGHLDRDLAALADAGLLTAQAVGVAITDAGLKRAALILGVQSLPRTWAEARNGRLIVKALGVEALPQRRQKALQKADGLRAAIVQKAFGLKIRGVPTPARLRIELARVVLRRAFSDSLPPEATGKSGMSAKAGRSLAGRLANPPRDFATDSRLVTALAIEHVRARKADLEHLQTALLRRYVTKGQRPVDDPVTQRPSKARARVAKARAARVPRSSSSRSTHTKAEAATALDTGRFVALLPQDRPDFAGFVTAIRTLADSVADGWAGNRRAFISRIWRALNVARPAWDLSEVEFKGMLAEAHRRAALVLSNADLKDDASLADVQASAVVFKNTVFHYVRVDD